MAKSSRSSRVKKNNQTLKRKVFGPVESARRERLNDRLMELAKQPKPSPPDEPDSPILKEAKPSTTDSEAKGTSSSSLSIPLPIHLYNSNDNPQNLPTPPTTPTLESAPTTTPILDMPAQKQLAKEMLFFHLLGAATDIVGFDSNGDLELSFAGPS
ncbi:hypothetical protein LTR37_005585 [Vermiconidia calcicola]|uniref:Uncharacterized protein n=1 Tax=Vermiconidia calcicola TaxID=1690605 RepID=A0ACC3NJ76_9PEZI|nr:hypothetical protein LTR37_005585 [Vermiconidia calcicola]